MQKNEIAGNRDTGLLKIVAFVFMVTDHVGARLFPGVGEMRILGRVAFPLYVWCMAVGASYTHDPWKYALRLLLVGVISQPCYMLGLKHTWGQLNVFCTLLLGYLGVLGIQQRRYGSQYWAPLLALVIPCFVNMDYGWRGVLLAMLMYLARQNRGAILAMMVAFCLYWGTAYAPITKVFGINLTGKFFDQEIVKAFLRLQTMAILALPLILWPKKTRTPLPKWLGYAAYPGHLILLWLVRLAVGNTTLQASLRLLFPWM